MGKTFGVKEATAASVFARTKEQKLTVLAVVKMLGMPIKLTKEVTKKTRKLGNSLQKSEKKRLRHENKAEVLTCEVIATEDEIENLQTTVAEWTV